MEISEEYFFDMLKHQDDINKKLVLSIQELHNIIKLQGEQIKLLKELIKYDNESN